MTTGAVPRTQRRSAHDIELNGIGLTLIEAIDIRQDPGTEPAPDAIYNDFSRGMGYSEEFVPGTYSWGENVCTRFGPALPGGLVTEVDVSALTTELWPFRSSVEFGGHLYFFGDRHVIKIPNGTGMPVLSNDLGTGVACGNQAAEVFQGNLYLGTIVGATGASYHLWKFDGATWTEHATVLRRALRSVYWDSGGLGAQRLVGLTTPTTFQTVASDPTVAGNWSSSVTVGNSSYAVLTLAATARHIYFVTNGGVYDVDARGYSANLTPYWQQSFSISSGNAAEIHEGDLYTNWGRGLVRVGLTGAREDTPEFCQPGADQPNGSPIFGYTNAMVADQGWLVAAIYNSTLNKSYICYGKDKRILGVEAIGPMIWHGAEVVLDGLVSHMRVSSPPGAQPRLWIWIEGSVSHPQPRLYWVSLPSFGNPVQEVLHGGNHQFAPIGSLYVRDGWERPNTRRVPIRYRIHADRLDGVAKVTVYRRNDAAVDGTGAPVYTRRALATVSPYTTAIDTSRTSAAQVDFRIDLEGGPSNPPLFRSLAVEADVNREQADLTRYVVEVMRPQITARGTRQRRALSTVTRAIKAISSLNGTPVSMTDEDGNTSYVQVLPDVQEHKTRARNGRWRIVLTFVCRKLWTPWQWGDGTLWGEGKFWGSA